MSDSPPQRSQTQRVFTELLGLAMSHEQRLAELQRRHGDNPELVAEVASLLEADRAVERGGFFDRLVSVVDSGSLSDTDSMSRSAPSGGGIAPTEAREQPAPAETEEPPLPEGTRIGPYRIVRRIGTGGMGTVYLAERQEPYRSTVALKVIRSSRRATLRQRFEIERQLHAQLAHPNIVRLLDGGNTDDGEPYLVMEYVDGTRISAYCDQQGLDLRSRAALMERVAEGVAYAHEQGIVHRDLTPNNILVGRDGVPRITDFGLARSLEPAISEQTQSEARMLGTPGYVAPEQVRGQPTRLFPPVDCYGLGAVLYRLLTGHRCFAEETSNLSALNAAAERDPVRPRKLNPAIPRDLETIVLRALARDPAERFGTASDLATQLRLFLAGKPLTIRPIPPWVRLSRWAGRHRVGVAAWSASFLAFLLIAIALLAAEQARTQEVLDNFTSLVADQLESADDLSQHIPLSNPGLLQFYEKIQAQYDILSQQQGVVTQVPLFQHQLAQSHFQVARALAHVSPYRTAAILRHLDRAIELLHAIVADGTYEPFVYLDLATAYLERSHRWVFTPKPHHSTGEADKRSMLAIEEEVVRRWPDDPRWRNVLADHRADWCRFLVDEHRHDEARDQIDRALSEIQPLIDRHENLVGPPFLIREAVHRRTQNHARVALVLLELETGHLEAAEAVARTVEQTTRRVRSMDPTNNSYGKEVILAGAELALVLESRGKTAEAIEVLNQAAQVPGEPLDPALRDVAVLLHGIGMQRIDYRGRLARQGHADPTLEADVRGLSEQLATQHQSRPEDPWMVADLGALLASGPIPGIRDPERALALLQPGRETSQTLETFWSAVALGRLGRWDEAMELARPQVGGAYSGQFHLILAWAEAHQGQADRARTHFAEAERFFTSTKRYWLFYPPLHEEVRQAVAGLAPAASGVPGPVGSTPSIGP